MDRAQRRQVIEETLAACGAGGYHSPAGNWVAIDDSETADRVALGRLHRLEEFGAGAEKLYDSQSLLHVVEGDCLLHAYELQQRGLSVCCLNMASPRRPGGGYLNGAGAQEENLFRRSNYYRYLEPSPDRPVEISYPLPEFSGVYSPDVDVFRGPEDQGYPFLDSPYRMSFVAVAAYSKPPLVKQGSAKNRQGMLWQDDQDVGAAGPRLTPEIPLAHGHNAVVLSALGCGAFANPPSHIAELFAEEIDRGGYRHAYRHILFAIIDDHNANRPDSPRGNLAPFREVLDQRDA